MARAENRSAPEREIGASMQKSLYVSLALLSGSLFAQVPEIPFDSAATLLKLPANLHLGEAAGVATNSKGNILVYTRTGGEDAERGPIPPRSSPSAAERGQLTAAAAASRRERAESVRR